jgi:hypothetical protein
VQKTGQALLYSFHPITGLPVDGTPPAGQPLDYSVVNAVALAQMDSHFLRPLLLLDSNKQVKMHFYGFLVNIYFS